MAHPSARRFTFILRRIEDGSFEEIEYEHTLAVYIRRLDESLLNT